MIEKPAWLPDIVPVNGEWPLVLARLYAIFDGDFTQVQRLFEGRTIWWDRKVMSGERYEEGFWHLITRTDQKSGDRLLDPRRAERLPWCGPTISHSDDDPVKVWDYREGSGRLRTYLWLEAWDYVVVLEKRVQHKGEIAFLVTAYHVDGDYGRRSLQTKYARRVL